MRVPACPSTQSPNGGGSGSCSNPNGSSGGSPAGASGGSPAGASGENGVHGGTARAKSVLPGLVGVGAVGETKSSTVATAAAAAAAAAADATTTQGSVALSTTGSTAPRNIDELADLTMLGARLKREKLQITQQAGALRKSLEAVRVLGRVVVAMTMCRSLCVRSRSSLPLSRTACCRLRSNWV